MVDRKALKYQLANVLISRLANGIQLKGKCVNVPIRRLANEIQFNGEWRMLVAKLVSR
jgi:hypothetical protein